MIQLAERLKCELRHSWVSDGRRESVAEHCWLMSLLAVLIHKYLEHPVDIEKSLKMIIVHDLVEVETGDIPFFENSTRKDEKVLNEQKAIKKIQSMLDSDTGEEIFNLWQEFEEGQTAEAKFAKAVDSLEVQLQHNFADFSTWEDIEYDLVYNKMDRFCEHDSFLMDFCNAVKLNAENKMISNGVEVEIIRKRVLAAAETNSPINNA